MILDQWLREVQMPDKVPLIQPGECVLLLVDLQAGLAFGVSSEDRQTLINNAIHAGHRQDIAVGTADRTTEHECLGG